MAQDRIKIGELRAFLTPKLAAAPPARAQSPTH
jgi:hypothetical protein